MDETQQNYYLLMGAFPILQVSIKGQRLKVKSKMIKGVRSLKLTIFMIFTSVTLWQDLLESSWQMVMELCYRHCNLGQKQIGEIFGVDYSMVSVNRSQLKSRLKSDRRLKKQFDQISERIINLQNYSLKQLDA
jgi:hypothetical protein